VIQITDGIRRRILLICAYLCSVYHLTKSTVERSVII